jgi:hypothetical protein
VPIVFCDNRKLAQEWTYRVRAEIIEAFRQARGG